VPQYKRKMESPGDGRKEFTVKRSRKGELTYAETCRREVDNNVTKREAILVKMEEGCDWIEVYRKIIRARNTTERAMGVRKTRAGHIFIEFERKIVVSEVAEKLKVALSDDTEVTPLVNRATLQIKNIDLLTTKEKLVENMRRKWGMTGSESVEVKTLRMNPWGGGHSWGWWCCPLAWFHRRKQQGNSERG
jgi:hypothetical protein